MLKGNNVWENILNDKNHKRQTERDRDRQREREKERERLIKNRDNKEIQEANKF